jgi:hypothetical protein
VNNLSKTHRIEGENWEKASSAVGLASGSWTSLRNWVGQGIFLAFAADF